MRALCGSDTWGAGLGDQRVVEIETNGAVDLAPLHALRGELAAGQGASGCRIYFTVDCKMPSSGMTAEMLPGNYDLLCWGDAVKFVVASREDLECAQQVIEKHDLCSRCEVFFSPVFSCIEPSQIVDFMQEQRLSRVRLQLQLHKIIWPGQEKGV